MSDIMYREITLYPECSDLWKDITINAGASQSTLQDIKLPETAGCFTYRGSGFLSGGTSNRFIYWRSSNDVLELVEVSLDINLQENHLRLRFQHSPILQGVSIHEKIDCVVLLVPTVSTIHKLLFPHPKSLQGKDYFLRQSNITYPSIFFDTNYEKLKSHSTYYILNHASNGLPLPLTSCSWLTSDGDASFVLANSAGSHLMVTMEISDGGKISTLELNRTSVMSRLWSGLVRNNQASEVLSLTCHENSSDVHIFSLCRDLRIRMWSQKKQDCLMNASILEYFGEALATFITNSNTQQCWLRSSVHQSHFFLGVYISLPQFNHFIIFQPLIINDQYRLSHVVTLMNSKNDLVDFCVSPPNVWGLWLTSESVPIIKVASFESYENNSNIGWSNVDLEPQVSSNIFIVDGETDPKDAYLKEILKPGRFSISTISKVLYIYHKATNPNLVMNTMVEPENIREEVIKVVENDSFLKGKETEISEEEYQELRIECWDKFFSYCIQYHEVGTKPLGISFDSSTGYAVVIKKNVYSLLCPCDPLEQLIKNEDISFTTNIEPSMKSSVVNILNCLNIIKSFLNESLVIGFEHELLQFHHSASDYVGSEIVKELMQLPSDMEGCLLIKLQSQFQMVSDPISAIKCILKEVDVSQKSEVYDFTGDPVLGFSECQHFLRSSTGISLLNESFTVFAKQRFEFCRDLLLLELLIVQLGERAIISSEIATNINPEILPHTKSLVHGYFVLKWMSETEFSTKPPTQLESSLQQLSILNLSENATFSKNVTKSGNRNLIYFYLEEQGRKDAYSMLSAQVSFSEFTRKPWSEYLPQLITNIAILLWPQGPYFYFPEFLLNHSQCEQLQEYNKLLKNWCDFNICSRQYLSANCLLAFGEYNEAVKLFIQAGEGVNTEDFLKTKIVSKASSNPLTDIGTSPIAQYYMKVIEIFEHYKLSFHVIELATTVIGILKENDLYLPIFWSLIFKHHLELGNSQKAYTALTRNPDHSRQKDCLRQMIVVLCERKEFQTLVQFPYLSMQDEVVNILETRARSSDLLHQNFYDLLYAFHIHTNNFRKAASIMFEYSMRLGQEINTFDGLQKQAACLLATINCLHLVDPIYAWIVKPVPKLVEEEYQNMSPKRDNDGEHISNLNPMIKKIEVLEIEDIRHEYDLIHARMLLVQKDDNNLAATPLGASDCVTLLINAGFFDVAIELCKAFSLSLIPVFEGLTYRCVTVMHHPSVCLKDDEELFDWLGQNDSTNLPSSGYISAKDQAWYMLKNYLIKYELKGQTTLHHTVASKLLSLNVHLPIWLKHSYQERNSSQLLWLYIKYGALEDASDLAINLIDAALGNGKENVGIKHQLRATNPPVWLPYSYFDALCDALEDIQNEPICTKLYQKLTKKIEEYVKAVEKVSHDFCQ